MQLCVPVARHVHFGIAAHCSSTGLMTTSASSPVDPDAVSLAGPSQGSDNDGRWTLLYQAWVLSTPGGQRLSLTATERACFLCLLESPRRELTRDTLAAILPQASSRTINVSISRLRKKLRALGVMLPLHTVHGLGYVFLGRLAAEDCP